MLHEININPKEFTLHRFTHELLKRALPNVIALHIPNEGKRSQKSGAILRSMGLLKGAPDWLVCVGPKAHFLELKSSVGVLSIEQRAFMVRAQDAGIPFIVARTTDEVVETLKVWGAIYGE